ncbi:MAG: hypothetical protein WBA76_15125 [Phormidesmis sp.]
MKPLYLLTAEPLSGLLQPDSPAAQFALHPTPQLALKLAPDGTPPKEYIRHILLGSPHAIRHTIHLLHQLRYSEPTLWTPALSLDEPFTLSPAQGEAMSLLRKPI